MPTPPHPYTTNLPLHSTPIDLRLLHLTLTLPRPIIDHPSRSKAINKFVDKGYTDDEITKKLDEGCSNLDVALASEDVGGATAVMMHSDLNSEPQ
ncbi:unnamed protein product [Lactuca virosa]|uniref:UBA domain-containing protein n=1 Tax=Lactuca virosa TaxID=75947 RepID=A0AAU9N7G9_9ASTR|nr:unnamed protein product [Lactuca virosa]